MAALLDSSDSSQYGNTEPNTPGSDTTNTTSCGLDEDKMEPIAIIGFSGRLPQDATSAESFWRLLYEGRSARTVIPKTRFNIDAFFHPDPDRIDSTNIKTGHFLKGEIGAFDAPFFSIQPAEAMSLDPQQRIMLEVSYRALENGFEAGIPMESVVGSKTSVFVGASARDYETLLLRDPENPAKYLGTGIGTSLLANRISWFFDLRGPSIALDTACSSSLSALHLACQSLRSHETKLGLVGGVNLILAPDVSMVHLSNMGFFSPDGKCYSFDHRANGYAKGEGAGVVVLKRLSDAIEDGDTIRAVIRGTGANQDGRTPGITQPSKAAQEQNIRETYKSAGLEFDTTKYFEAHGTGTQVGDPIEAGAIHNAFQRDHENPLYVGALKTNIGHLEAASGVASLMKTVMTLENGIIPPNLWFERPNDSIHAEKWGLKFPTEPTPWPSEGVRRASVNSFGYGGANAHAIIDDALHYMNERGIKGRHCTSERPSHLSRVAAQCQIKDDIQSDEPPRSYKLSKIFVLSASDEDGIRRLKDAYEGCISTSIIDGAADHPDYLDNVAFTLSNKRSSLPWKAFAVAQTALGLCQGLTFKNSKPNRSSVSPLISFIFTGQGSQWAGMGLELLRYPIFEASLRRSSTYLESLGCEWTLMNELSKVSTESDIDNPAKAQPLCTALQIGLVDLVTHWGIFPAAAVGHSSGEIAAAYCMGSLSHRSAIKIAYFRGAFAAQLAKDCSNHGGMLSVSLSESEVKPFLEDAIAKVGHGKLSAGCVNSPKSVTITGDRDCIDALNAIMKSKGIFARKLPISVAYHSSYMQEIASEYSESIANITPRVLPIPRLASRAARSMFSSVSGKFVPAEALSQSEYWVTNLVSQVKFSEALSQMCHYLVELRTSTKTSKDVLIEIGPHAGLQRPVKDTIEALSDVQDITYDFLLKRGESDVKNCLDCLGRLHCLGYRINFPRVNSPAKKQAELRMMVDLPSYPFNHVQSYWYESRVSKNFRMRKHARHELFGTPSADWNPAEPKWRNIIRLADNPWIADHKLDGSVLFPAAGMITAAVEANRQYCESYRKVVGYHLNDLVFHRALPVSESPDGVETQLQFHPGGSTAREEDRVNGFKLYALSNDEWSSICEGSISCETRNTSSDQVPHTNGPSWIQTYLDSIKRRNEDCESKLKSEAFYSNLRANGFEYGPAFQALKDIRYSKSGRATATVKLDGWKDRMNVGVIQDHVIHPTTLDGILQLTMAAISNGTSAPIPPMVPTQAKSIWISHDLLTRSRGEELHIFTDITIKGYREADFSIVGLDANDNVRIAVAGWRELALNNSLEPFSLNSSSGSKLCYQIDWKPDLTFMTSLDALSFCGKVPNHAHALSGEDIDSWELASLIFMSKALEDMKHGPIDGLPVHLQKYVDWMKRQYHSSRLGSLIVRCKTDDAILQNGSTQDTFLNAFAFGSPEGALCVEVGRNLMSILKGEKDALDLLFSGTLVQNFYHSPSFQGMFSKISAFVELMAHKNPKLQILEVGAGTGAATVPLLRSLTDSAGGDGKLLAPRFGRYDFTDISTAFFENAKGEFSAYSNRMNFAALDIEKDLASQGFDTEKYDLIIGSLVLHATADLSNTLQNTRRLLKPGGRLILLEPSNPSSARVSFVFGLLSGWWLSKEENRQWGPLLSDDGWQTTLLENGFSGVDLCFKDNYDEERHTFSAIVTTAVDDQHLGVEKRKKTFLIVSKDSPFQLQMAAEIERSMKSDGILDVTIQNIEEIGGQDTVGALCIVLVEVGKPFLTKMSMPEFSSLKQMISDSDGILWVTQGCVENAETPQLGLVTGFGRTVRSENWGIRFVELALETDSPQVTSHVFSTYKASFFADDEAWESEFMEKDGIVHISRTVETQELNQLVDSKLVQKAPRLERLGNQSDRRLELAISTPGMLETLYMKDDVDDKRELAPDELEIQVHAVELSFEDSEVALGRKMGSTLGSACSGVVIRLGIDVSGLQIGDRVTCSTATGSFKTKAKASASSTMLIPEQIPFEEAAAYSTSLCKAYYSLHRLCRLDKGEWILISSALSPVGQAAIHIASVAEARISALVGTVEDAATLHQTSGIPMDRIFVHSGGSFDSSLLQTAAGGFDVVFESSPQETLRDIWGCIRPLGRYVRMRGRNDQSKIEVPAEVSALGITFASFDLDTLMTKAKMVMADTMSAVTDLLSGQSKQILRLQSPDVFDVSEVEQAFRRVDANKAYVVVRLNEALTVPIAPSMKSDYSFNSDATYVIVGGFGGLGRTIIAWMADRGAHHFLVLSRSGDTRATAKDLIREMHGKGVQVIGVACDITRERSVVSALEDSAHQLPPIRGCIQASMVLKDGLFENSTLEDYNTAIKPKVDGSWNLHTALPQDLDFFVLLSSVSGITGSRGQTNYASGNTYQDALARHRVSGGQKCISVNLGSILDVGFAAEQDLTQALEKDGFRGIKKSELLAILDHCCDPGLPIPSNPFRSQIVTGLNGIDGLDAERMGQVYWANKPLFSILRASSSSNDLSNLTQSKTSQQTEVDYAGLLRDATTFAAAHNIVLNALIQKLANGLNIPIDDIDPDQAIYTFGIDSLVALEVRYWFLKEMGAEVSVIDIMQSPSLRDLARKGVERSNFYLKKEEDTKESS